MFLGMVVEVFQASAEYTKTVLTFVLIILILVLGNSSFEFKTILSCRIVVHTLRIRSLISVSNNSFLSRMACKYVKTSISFRTSHATWFSWYTLLFYRIFLSFPVTSETYFCVGCCYIVYLLLDLLLLISKWSIITKPYLSISNFSFLWIFHSVQ